MRTRLIDIELNVRKIDHVKIDGARILRNDLRKVHNLLLCALAGIGRRVEINGVDLYAPLCDHVARNRRIDTAREKEHGLSAGSNGHAARSRDDLGIDIDLLADLHVQHNVGIMNVHRHLRISVQKHLAKVRIDLHGLLWIVLSCAARIHLKGLIFIWIHLVNIVHDALCQLFKALILRIDHWADAGDPKDLL